MYSELWQRADRVAELFSAETYYDDPTLTSLEAMQAALQNPMAAAVSISPAAAAYCDLIRHCDGLGILATVDLDNVVLGPEASSRAIAASQMQHAAAYTTKDGTASDGAPSGAHAPRVALARFRLTLSNVNMSIGGPAEDAYKYVEAGAVCSTAFEREHRWQVCLYDRPVTLRGINATSMPPVLLGATYMYMPAHRDIIILLQSVSEAPEDDPVGDVKRYLFDVLGEYLYEQIERWTIVPSSMYKLDCDYALRPIIHIVRNLEEHYGIYRCSTCGVTSANTNITDAACSSCRIIAGE